MNTYFAVTSLADMSPLEVHKLYKLRVDTIGTGIDDADANPGTHHVLAWDHTDRPSPELHGYARILPTSTGVLEVTELSHLYAVDGSGLVRDILDNALRLAAERYPDRDVVVTAPEDLQGLYESFGFRSYGRPGDGGHPMILSTTRLHAVYGDKVNA
ncbi:hypothetical protein [Corynebacterium pacaense]|uniref:hypothetical protein n=1 Tax=Corynebacterium pacaense TaxID=1816684 RepID=UPI0009BACD7D|nr:hypothetical protein [Corynebacterium pacaense]